MIDSIDVKLILVGSEAVGKTCIVQRLISGQFSENRNPTLGASYLAKNIVIGNKEVRLQIWDTAGQERYRGMTPMYYRDAKVALIVYSVTEPDSFNEVESWYDSLRNHADPDIQIYLVANKIDIEPFEVPSEKGEQKANEIGGQFYSVSAKTGEGVENLFYDIAKANLGIDSSSYQIDKKLDLNDGKKKSKNCC